MFLIFAEHEYIMFMVICYYTFNRKVALPPEDCEEYLRSSSQAPSADLFPHTVEALPKARSTLSVKW